MKKFLTVLLVLLIALSPIFAETTSPFGNMTNGTGDAWGVKGITNRLPHVLSPRVYAEGNTGTSLSTGVDSLYMNPANLAKNQKFFIDIPYLNVEVMSVASLLQSLKPTEGTTGPSWPSVVLTALENANHGNSPVLYNVNAGVGFTVKGFGLNVFADVGMFSYSPGGTGDAQIFNMMTAGVTLGYGFNVLNRGPHKLALGISANFMFRAYTKPYTYPELVNILSDMNTSGGTGQQASFVDILKILFRIDQPTMAGFMHPFSVGMSYTYSDWLTVSVAMRDLWTSQTGMTNFANLSDAFYGMFGSKDKVRTGTVKYGFMDTASLDVGIAFNPHMKWFNPRLEIDFCNLTNYTDKEKSDFLRLFLSHFRVGAEIYLVEFLSLRAGLDSGRLSFGVGLDLFPIVIEATYGWREWGEWAGDKAVDYFSVVVKLGWDRTK